MSPTLLRTSVGASIALLIPLIFFWVSPPSSAQSTLPSFGPGDRVEAAVGEFINESDRSWRNATVVRVFEPMAQGAVPVRDDVIGAIADAVAARGSDALMEPNLLDELKIAHNGSSLRAKTMTRVVKTPTGVDRMHTVYAVTADRRYTVFSRRFVSSEMIRRELIVVVDDSGRMISRRTWKDDEHGQMAPETANAVLEVDGFDWVNVLLGERLGERASWHRTGFVVHLVKVDGGGHHLLPARSLRLPVAR